MKEKTVIRVSSRALLDGLQKVQRVVQKKSAQSILSYIHVRVDAERKMLTVTGGNGETQVEADVHVQEAGGNAGFCVETIIVDLLKTVCDQPVDVEVETERTGRGVEDVRVRVRHDSGVWEIAGADDELYPFKARPDGKVYEMKGGCLSDGIRKTCGFASKDSLRPILNGVYADLPGDGSVTFVATDMGNLSRYTSRLANGEGAEGFLIPNGTAGVLAAVSGGEGDVRVTAGGKTLLFEQNGVRVTGVRAEGRYPNYKSVFRECTGRMIVDADALKAALERLLKVTNGAAAIVHVEVDKAANTLRMAAEDVDWKRSGEETLSVDSDGDLSANVNGKFVCEMLGIIDGEAVIRFIDGAHMILIEPLEQKDGASLTMLTMPMYGK